MKNHLKEIRSNNDGFTLLEVLVSMIILTIVCVPLFRSFATSAQTNARAKIQARCTTASENIMEKIRNMPTEDILTTFSGATASGVDIHFEIEDNATMNADLPDGYKAIVDLNPNTDPDGYDAYPNANSLNMADFSPISVRDCAIYTMPSGYDKEAYDWYETKSTAFGTNKDWKYFRNELTRDIVFTIEDTGIPYTDDEGNTKNAIKVKMDIWYYCNASSIVDPITERKHVTSSVYLFDNTASHNDLSSIYLFYYPRYIASTGGGAIRKDVIEVNNPANIDTDVYIVAMNNAAYEQNSKRNEYLMAGKGLKLFINEGNMSGSEAGVNLKTNLLKTSATTTLRTPYYTGDTATDYGLGLDLSFKAGTRRAYNTPGDADDLIDELQIADIDGKSLKSDINVRIYKVTVSIVNTATGEEMSKMEGTKLRHMN